MELQYVKDENGQTTAVLVPIDEWKDLTERYTQDGEIPQWQKDMVNERIAQFRKNPGDVVSMEEMEKVFKEDEDEED